MSMIVFESPQRSACMEARLVLEAVGLTASVSREAELWRVSVPDRHANTAIAELNAYRHDESESRTAAGTTHVSLDQLTLESAGVVALTVVACTLLGWSTTTGTTITGAGQIVAESVQAGQWWRCLTALTLHLDGPHLLSNLLFGALFITVAGKWLGGGMASLFTVLAGALGNLCNVFLQDPSHISLGASTGVFAALGIAVANALRPRMKTESRVLLRWSPLVAGGVLLAMIGTGGERTDVGAHFAGFLMGLASGWLSTFLPSKWLGSRRLQWSAAVTASALLCGAWIIALANV